MNKDDLLRFIAKAKINKLDISQINPKQFIFDDIPVTIHKIDYSYTTVRGNKKTGEKYMVVNSINPQLDIKPKFEKWVREYNSNNPSRSLSNVKFLDSEPTTLLVI